MADPNEVKARTDRLFEKVKTVGEGEETDGWLVRDTQGIVYRSGRKSEELMYSRGQTMLLSEFSEALAKIFTHPATIEDYAQYFQTIYDHFKKSFSWQTTSFKKTILERTRSGDYYATIEEKSEYGNTPRKTFLFSSENKKASPKDKQLAYLDGETYQAKWFVRRLEQEKVHNLLTSSKPAIVKGDGFEAVNSGSNYARKLNHGKQKLAISANGESYLSESHWMGFPGNVDFKKKDKLRLDVKYSSRDVFQNGKKFNTDLSLEELLNSF